VTVWIDSAHTIDTYTSGMKIFSFTGLPVYFETQVPEADDDVQEQVAVEHQHVPAQHRREAVDAERRDHVPQAARAGPCGAKTNIITMITAEMASISPSTVTLCMPSW